VNRPRIPDHIDVVRTCTSEKRSVEVRFGACSKRTDADIKKSLAMYQDRHPGLASIQVNQSDLSRRRAVSVQEKRHRRAAWRDASNVSFHAKNRHLRAERAVMGEKPNKRHFCSFLMFARHWCGR
jgi:hypothetical protein